MLFWLARSLSRVARPKGRSRWWGALGVALWVAGELFGFVLGGALGFSTMASYGLALPLAAAGAAAAYFLVLGLPPHADTLDGQP